MEYNFLSISWFYCVFLILHSTAEKSSINENRFDQCTKVATYNIIRVLSKKILLKYVYI